MSSFPFSSVCVFCGARTGSDPKYARASVQLASYLAANDITLLYGGGNVGLMGTIADAALEVGGEVIGVIPQSMVDAERAHTGLTELHVVQTLMERKKLLADLSDAFIALPGGVGTLDELSEMITWNQLQLQDKPVGLLDVEDFFAPLWAFLQNATELTFIPQGTMDKLSLASTPAKLLDSMSRHVIHSTVQFVSGACHRVMHK